MCPEAKIAGNQLSVCASSSSTPLQVVAARQIQVAAARQSFAPRFK
jgi:hypothetical protein